MTILAYVSGHGFGHWTRSEALLERLAEDEPVHVRTGGRSLILARHATWAASVEEREVGTGVVQDGPLRVDVAATRALLERHLAAWDEAVRVGVEEGQALGVRLVFGDAPPIAFAIAQRLGVPSVAMANFSWSWAYAHYVAADPYFSEASAFLGAAEGLATRLIPLPGGGGLEAFGDVGPFLALRRPPTLSREDARARLDALTGSRGQPIVLLSFGGYGDALDLSAGARANPDTTFVTFAAPAGSAPDNLTVLPHDHGLAHQDLVFGADALIAKPGYGTVSECLSAPTPLVHVVPSGAFREHTYLVDMIERWLPHAPISGEDLTQGAWSAALARANDDTPSEPPPPDGLARALEIVRAN